MKTRDEQLTRMIGLRIQNKRKARGMTVTDLQNKTGISRSTIQNYESSLRQPPLENIKKIAEALNASAAYLAGLSEQDGGAKRFVAAESPLVGKSSEREDSVAFNANTLAMKGLSSAGLALLKVTDDSLLPDIPKGAEVLVNTADTDVNTPDIFAIQEKNSHILVRWARRDMGCNDIIIYSIRDQHHFPPVTLSTINDSVVIIGRVVCTVNWR